MALEGSAVDESLSCLKVRYGSGNARVLSWRLTAWGSAYSDCGDWYSFVACPERQTDGQTYWVGGEMVEHELKHLERSCDRPECPTCYGRWAGKQAKKASERIIQAYGLYENVGVRLGKVRHIVFSPEQSEGLEAMRIYDGFKSLRSLAVRYMKQVGCLGGCYIFHPFRQKGDDWYPSPHFHFVGYFKMRQKSNDFHAQTGWVYKNIGKRKSVKGTIFYQLTHCGLAYDVDGSRPVFKTLVWFGLLSYNKIVSDGIMEKPVKCACGLVVHRYGMDLFEDVINWDDDRGQVFEKIPMYKLRGAD